MPAVRHERTLGELFGEFSQDMTRLVRQEIRLARTEMSEKLAVQGAIPVGNSAEEFARFVKSEMDQWGKLAQKIGLKPD